MTSDDLDPSTPAADSGSVVDGSTVSRTIGFTASGGVRTGRTPRRGGAPRRALG